MAVVGHAHVRARLQNKALHVTTGAGEYVLCGDEVFRIGIVVASELPRSRATLLVRLMAAGPLLSEALADLVTLPADAHERAVAEQNLLRLQHVLGKKARRTPEEQEFIVTMQNTWEKARDEGSRKGQLIEARTILRRVLARRGLELSADAEARIDACTTLATLEHWIDEAVVASSAAEALGLPRRV